VCAPPQLFKTGVLGTPMGNYPKHDHAPLLAPGGHYFSVAELEPLCVGRFAGPSRDRRQTLFYGLEELVQRLLVATIPCKVFVDGSFLTEKPEPDDVDAIVVTELCVFESLSEDQMQVLEAINKPDFVAGVDSLAVTAYPRDHEFFGTAIDMSRAGEAYGLEHGQVWLKGYAVIRLWETDVGYRICR
jgi:hypothetical protein